uniref:RNA-binding protein 10 n=1 Tax=Cacopsylla melanoneura TaxID=428564 RepID=A0A8D8Q510_9HEMI
MSNQWNNATPKIWEIPPNTYGAGSSTSSQPYSSAPPGYYNAPPPTQQPLYNQQYAVAGTAQDYQQASQMMPGYSYNPATQLAPSNVLPQADASMVLNAVNTLNQSLGGLDIDPELLNALSRQIQNERESDQKPPHRAEIYSPTLNSPSPSPYHSPERRIEVDGKKLVTSKPFYEQFNHYEDDLANDDMTSRVDQFLSATTSRRSRSPRDRTWAGSNSPPSPGRRDMNSRSPLSHRPRLDDKRGMTHRSRHEDSATRRGRSRSPLRRTRSRSREIEVDRSLGEKVTVLLEMSKSENRKFVSSQQPSSVLMVVNLIRYISDKDLWGAIHKYARDYGTKPPFYIEKASFTLSKTIPMTFLALIAFPTVSAAEMCMKHTNCELEIAGRVKKHFKMMYYSENTILFDALNSKFTGIWRSVLKQRLRLRRGEGDDDRDSKSPRESRSRDRSKSKDRARLMESECVRSDNKRKSIEKRKSPDCKPDKSESNSSKLSNRAQTGKLRENQKSVKDETPDSDSEESCKSPTKTKAQPNVNIIKTNVFIGKMKSYLVNQNKNKPEKIEINITSSSIGGQSSSAKKDLDPKQPAKSSNKSIPPKAENKKDVEKVTPKVSQTAPKDVPPPPLPPLPPREKNRNETGTPSTNTAEISNSKLSTDSKTTKDYEKQKQPTKKVEENKVFKENETVSKEISKGKSATANIKVEPKKENNTSNNPQKSSAKTSTAVCSSNTTKQSPSDKSSESNETKSLKRKDDVQSDNLKKSVDKTPTTKKAQIVKEKSSDDGKLKPEKDCSNASLSSIPIPDLIVKTEPTHVDEKKKEPTKNVADIKEPKENKTPPKEEKVAPKLGKVSATNTPKTEVKNEKSESKTSSVKILEKVDQTETSQKAPVKTNTDVVKPNSKSTDINTSIPKASGTAQKSKENENDPQNRSKRKISPPRSENVRSVKPKTNDQDGAINDLVTPPQQKEDSISDQEREEEEAELFGARLDKYSNREIGKQSYKALHKDRGFKRGRGFDRRDDSSYNQGRAQSREDRFSRDNRGRGGYNDRRPNRDYQDKRRRGDDDIDGNEDGYWNTTRESKQQPAPVNPWIQNETPNDKNTSLSLNELKDPEFLLRVLLQTSIMIQNNQLTMDNPLDSLTPTDKELILQTLNEIEATSQVVIYATVNNRSTFNAAEQRVLTEALSNIHMFKAALIPPGNKNQEEMKKDVRPLVCHKKEEADVYVSMSNIHTWISKDFIVKILRNLNLNFECVEIYPCLKNDSTTSGHIKFKDFETASELLRKTNRTLYVGKDPSGIQLSISDVAKRSPKWVCNSCSMRNSSETVICMKCQKLKEKLADIQVTTEVTNKLVLINFKKETTVDEMQKILMKIAPFLTATVVAHIDSTNDQVVHFIIELVNPQACSMMKKAIRDHMEEFSRFQAGPRVAISFVIPQLPPATSTNNKYTFADVPRLAHYSASLYATNEEERMKYFNHYTTLYTQELVLGNPINVVLPEDTVQTVTGPPTGSDDRLWPPPHVNGFTYDQNSGYYYDHSTGLYYEPSSQYFYNMDTRKFLLYDTGRSTYVLVQNNSEISSAPVKSVAKPPSTITNPTTRLPQESQDDQNMEKTGNASCPPTKESRIHAKKVMKDLEKWSKSVNKQDKKKAAPNVFDQYANSGEKASPADVGFDIMRRTETVKSSTSASVSSVPSISSLIMEHTVCEDEEEEYAFIDLKNFTCNLCHRVFNSADVLNKHSKLSDLHRNNLKKWYISKNLDPDNEENRKQQYRDRAAERRNKTTGKQRTRHEGRGSSPVETWLCGTPGCMVYKRSGFDLCYDCEKDADSRSRLPPPGPKYTPTPPVSDLSVGSQLLRKMGWEQGSGLGKMRQGTRQPIQVEKQSGYQGLGAQKQELREEGESYMAFLKRSTQKRYEQLSNDY